MYALDTEKLAAYPGVKIPTAATGELVATLVAGKINGALKGALTLPDPDEIDPIAFEVAARALRNPTGATSITSGIDDWKQTLRYEGEQALATRAGVHLTPEERAELRALAGFVRAPRRPKSITIRPGW